MENNENIIKGCPCNAKRQKTNKIEENSKILPKNLNNKQKIIVLTGGGTAGHVYPALAVAENLNDCDLHYIGGNGIEKEILKNFDHITYHQISGVKLERKLTPKNLLLPFKLFRAVKEAKNVLQKIKPDIIFSKGGFVAVPVVLASKKLKIPVISHESDLSFGLANKIILRYAKTMCTTFEPTAKGKNKCVHTGQPIRKSVFCGRKQGIFHNNKPTLLVLGGSLGAKFLNDIVFENLDDICKDFNVLHICGKNNFKEISHEGYKSFPFVSNIEDLFATADLALSRAGSGVINELLCLQKPMLLIPLSKKCSRGDQIENAHLFENLGYAKMLEEEDYSYKKLKFLLKSLLDDSQKIKENMKKTAKNNASGTIAKMLTKS